VAQAFSLCFGRLPAAELVPEFPVSLAHFAAKILAGLAQFALDVPPGPAKLFARFPSGASELFMGSPDFRTIPEGVVMITATRHGENN
jgi:hypothetical protein